MQRDNLQERLGYAFRNADLLDLALTHRSSGQDADGPRVDNETLEFLGDSILGFVVADALRREAGPEVEVGVLSRVRSSLVSEASLAPRARSLGLGPALRLGKGEERTGGRDKTSILADAFEAVVAAVYLDGGMRAARAFILRQFPEGIHASRPGGAGDPKTRLQEALQAEGRPLPEYRVVGQEGPDHARMFTIEVYLEGRSLARGKGRTKKAAEMESAKQALSRLAERKLRAQSRPGRGPRGPRRRAGGRG